MTSYDVQDTTFSLAVERQPPLLCKDPVRYIASHCTAGIHPRFFAVTQQAAHCGGSYVRQVSSGAVILKLQHYYQFCPDTTRSRTIATSLSQALGWAICPRECLYVASFIPLFFVLGGRFLVEQYI